MSTLIRFVCALVAFPLICGAQDDLSNGDKKKLDQRFQADKNYALNKRKNYEAIKEQVGYVGENIKSLIDDWGPATRVVDNGNGELVYVYEKEVYSSGGYYDETDGKDTRYSSSSTIVQEVSVDNNVITHIERSIKAFPDQRRDTKSVFQTDLTFRNKGKEILTGKVTALIRNKNYTVLSKRLYPKKTSVITYRNFERICTIAACGSDLYAIAYVKLEIDSASIKVKVDQVVYSSIIGGKMIINDAGYVVTENDEPFNLYSEYVPKAYEKAYPEAMLDHKGKIRNQFIHDKVTRYYEKYIKEIESAINN